jgi:hypothetical protein
MYVKLVTMILKIGLPIVMKQSIGIYIVTMRKTINIKNVYTMVMTSIINPLNIVKVFLNNTIGTIVMNTILMLIMKTMVTGMNVNLLVTGVIA